MPFLQRQATALLNNFSRFPMALLAWMVVVILHQDLVAKDGLKTTLWTISLLSFPLLTGLELLAFRSGWRRLVTLALGIGVTALVVAWMPDTDTASNSRHTTEWLFFLTAVSMVPFIAPYWRRWQEAEALSLYINKTALAVIIGVIFAGILWGTYALLLIAAGYLFDYKDLDDAYALSLGSYISISFAGLYFLANIPKDFSFKDTGAPRPLVFLVSYIGLPALAVFGALMLAYGLKILLLWELPKGNLGGMSIGFAGLGIAFCIIAASFPNGGTALVRAHKKYFPYVLPAILALLWVAILTRVFEHGLTEPRIVVLILATWFTFTNALFLFRPQALVASPLFLMVLLLVFSGLPFSPTAIANNNPLAKKTESESSVQYFAIWPKDEKIESITTKTVDAVLKIESSCQEKGKTVDPFIVSIDCSANILTVKNTTTSTVLTVDLHQAVKDLMEQKTIVPSGNSYDLADKNISPRIERQQGELRIQLIFKNINGTVKTGQLEKLSNYDFYLLIGHTPPAPQ